MPFDGRLFGYGVPHITGLLIVGPNMTRGFRTDEVLQMQARVEVVAFGLVHANMIQPYPQDVSKQIIERSLLSKEKCGTSAAVYRLNRAPSVPGMMTKG